MPSYKLLYFNVTGLGEPIRYLFAYGKIPFEDKRTEFADFQAIKATTPYGKLPVLEVDGKTAHQSNAICRYLAKQAGILGKSDWDQLQADAVVDTLTDLRLQYTSYFREQDEAVKATKLAAIKATDNPFFFGNLEKTVKENGGYFVNGQLTWADIFFASIAEMLINVAKEPILDAFPNLKALKEKVEKLPGIKEYRATRPVTML